MDIVDRFFHRALIEIWFAPESDLDFLWQEYATENGECVDFDTLVDLLYDYRNHRSLFPLLQGYDWSEWFDLAFHFFIETPPTTMMLYTLYFLSLTHT